MKVAIGSMIASLRKAKGVTQGQLAAAVGVSPPAVSKWEAEQSFPDITLLAPLARYFQVSVDTLLAYRPILTLAQVEDLGRECSAAFAEQGWVQGVALCSAMEREHPTDSHLKLQLAVALQQSMVFCPGPPERELALQKQEELLSAATTSDDPRVQLASKYLLGSVYVAMQDLEKAESLFDSLPTVEFDPRQILPSVYMRAGRLGEAERMAQTNLLAAINAASLALTSLVSVATKNGLPERAKRFSTAQQAMLDIFGIGQAFGLFANQSKLMAASIDDNDDQLLAALENLIEGISAQAEQAMPLCGIDFFDKTEVATNRFSSNHLQAIQQAMAKDLEQNPHYAALVGHPRFEALLRRLK